MEIRVDDLSGAQVQALLAEHLRAMNAVSPPESVHALDLSGLRQADVTFWSIWSGPDLAGCGALKQLDDTHAEIKSMRTADAFRRRGVGARMLRHLIEEAQRRGYRRLSLETGSMDYFEPARRLYGQFGFAECRPFGAYAEDPNSMFMTREL